MHHNVYAIFFTGQPYNEEAIATSCLNVATALVQYKQKLSRVQALALVLSNAFIIICPIIGIPFPGYIRILVH